MVIAGWMTIQLHWETGWSFDSPVVVVEVEKELVGGLW